MTAKTVVITVIDRIIHDGNSGIMKSPNVRVTCLVSVMFNVVSSELDS